MTDLRIPPPQANITYRLAHIDYPMRVIPGCKTCDSDLRPAIEHMVLMGFGWRKIAESLPDLPGVDRLTPENLREHYDNGHMPLPEAQRRAVIERRARFKRVSSMDADMPMVDPYIVQSAIMQKGYERLMTGQIAPDVKDLISAAKEVGNLERESREEETINEDAVINFIQAAREFMEPDDFMRWVSQLETNPAMSLYRQVEEDIEEGEVVEDRHTFEALPPVGDKAQHLRLVGASSNENLPAPLDGADGE